MAADLMSDSIPGAGRARRPTHYATHAKWHRLGSAGTLLVPVLVVALVSAVCGAAVALLVHLPAYVSPKSRVNMGASSVEQVVAKVLPSVVTLQSSLGEEV